MEIVGLFICDGRATLTGEIEKGLKKSESIGTMCLCKPTRKSQWSRRTNFARIRCVPQEAKLVRATSSFMIESDNDIAVRDVERRSASEEERCSRVLRKPTELIVIVVTLLSYGCPIQAIVHAFGLDERTVASWRDRAGTHCQHVHQQLVETGQLDLVHVQADEIRVKGCKMIAWMGLAMMISSRLWLAGTVNLTRDRSLADRLMRQVRACAQAMGSLLICTDGWAAYPNSIRRAFREKVKKTLGRGRACLQIWPDLHIGTVIKCTEKKRVVEVSRTMSHGSHGQAEALLKQSAGGSVLNTAFIERLNATMRERLATLTRKCRHGPRHLLPLEKGMYLTGSTYNWCWVHQELFKPAHLGYACTPAMAAGLTDHIWSVFELLRYKVAPSPWVEPKRRGQPKKQAEQTTIPTKRQSFRPLLRLRKGVLCSTTS